MLKIQENILTVKDGIWTIWTPAGVFQGSDLLESEENRKHVEANPDHAPSKVLSAIDGGVYNTLKSIGIAASRLKFSIFTDEDMQSETGSVLMGDAVTELFKYENPDADPEKNPLTLLVWALGGSKRVACVCKILVLCRASFFRHEAGNN